MKKIPIILAVLTAINISVFAQCDKKVAWSASKADFMDEAGNIQDTKNVTVAIYTNKKEIKITHSDDVMDTLQGVIKEFSCDWKQPYKNGKTVMKADLMEKNGEHMNSIITIEAIESKISISINMEGPDGKKMVIKIPVDNYKEEKN